VTFSYDKANRVVGVGGSAKRGLLVRFERPARQQVMSAWLEAAWNSGTQTVFTRNPALAQAGTGLAYEYRAGQAGW